MPRSCRRWFVLTLLLWVGARQASGQNIPAKGTEATLDVATWNIEWFGSASNGPADDALQRANVRAVVEQADIDLWAVQEIADLDAFRALLDSLGGAYDGVLATESGTQRIGFIYKTDVVRNAVARHILTSFSDAFAGRPPLQLEADVVLADTTMRLTFITIHMKCCGDASSYDRRVEAAQRLKNHIDFLLPADPILVLGDLNDELGGSIRAGQPSPYRNFLDDAAGYAFLTLPLDRENVGTFCNNSACTSGSTLDHLLITDELFSAYQADSAARFDELVSDIDRYTVTTSDHLPVFARFLFGTRTATEAAAVPETVAMEAAYPDPFSSHTTLVFTLARPGEVRLDVFDVLGRRVATPAAGFRPAGRHRVVFEAGALPPGLYLLRLTAGRSVRVRQVVHR